MSGDNDHDSDNILISTTSSSADNNNDDDNDDAVVRFGSIRLDIYSTTSMSKCPSGRALCRDIGDSVRRC